MVCNMQEKVSIVVALYRQKFPSLGSRFGITKHGRVMPNRDPWDRNFCLYFTAAKGTYKPLGQPHDAVQLPLGKPRDAVQLPLGKPFHVVQLPLGKPCHVVQLPHGEPRDAVQLPSATSRCGTIITPRQASWCGTVDIMMEFSICFSQLLKY